MLRHHDVNTMYVDCSSGILLTQHRSRNGRVSFTLEVEFEFAA